MISGLDVLDEAERENRLIAEKVMGLEHREWQPYHSPEGWYPKEFRGPVCNDGGYLHHPRGYEDRLPWYRSSNENEVGDGWKVVAKMEELGYRLKLVKYTDGWYCAFAKENIDEAKCVVSKFPAHAICDAALAALSGRQND